MKDDAGSGHDGYVLHRRGYDDGIYLPSPLAFELKEQVRREREVKDAEDAARREAAAAAHRSGKEAKAETVFPAAAPAAPRGWHRVLPAYDAMLARLADIEAGGVHADREQGKRDALALRKAALQGPDRALCMPDAEVFAQLELELPAFAPAIGILRNAFQLAARTGRAPVVPPLLLLGPAGVGKSYFASRLTECTKLTSRWLAMDTPSAGSQLCGSDKVWGNSTPGILFELLGHGVHANPLIVLDEIDKARRRQASGDIDPLAQLYTALEPLTAKAARDISLDVVLDASCVMYIATANGLANLDAALLSRFEVIAVPMPDETARRETARRVADAVVRELGCSSDVRVSSGCFVILGEFSPRMVRRTVEKAVAASIAAGSDLVTAEDIEAAIGLAAGRRRVANGALH